jgi:hypothetical protein
MSLERAREIFGADSHQARVWPETFRTRPFRAGETPHLYDDLINSAGQRRRVYMICWPGLGREAPFVGAYSHDDPTAVVEIPLADVQSHWMRVVPVTARTKATARARRGRGIWSAPDRETED